MTTSHSQPSLRSTTYGQSLARGIRPVLTSIVIGLTAAKLERLRAFAQVNVS